MSTRATAVRARESLVDGEFELTAADFRALADVLHEVSGIALPEGKAALVYSRLAKRLRALGLRSFRDYTALISDPESGEERSRLLMALTTNVTRFYREPHHFTHLADKVLAPRIETVRGGHPLRLWSAACSSGQEAYSIALSVLSVLPDAAERGVRILGTDIDESVIAVAREGVYPAADVECIPPALRSRWMNKDASGAWRMNDAVRSLISFRPLNLVRDWPMRRAFDAIFCRNVVIYFDEPTQARLWRRFASQLTPEGRLYVGHSERVLDSAFQNDGQTVYRLARGGAQ